MFKIALNFFILLQFLFSPLFGAEMRGSFNRALEKSQSYPKFCYPYSNIKKTLEDQGKEELVLFAYGSLIDYTSASRTLSESALSTRQPALAFGFKRVFNRDSPISPGSRWGKPNDPSARGMLNVQVTEQPTDFMNGVAIRLPLSDLEALLEREVGYHLVPTVILGWDDYLNNRCSYEVGYILKASPGTLYVNSEVLPRPGYYEVTRNAAEQYGSLFQQVWMETTFLADGVTPIAVWDLLVRALDPITQIIIP